MRGKTPIPVRERLCVVIPSRTASNLVPCIAAVRQHEPEARIIVVDDGVNFGDDFECLACVIQRGERIVIPRRVDVLPGIKPFIFSRAVNQGLQASGDADCVVQNDDATLETSQGYTMLQQVAAANPEYGIISAVMRSVGNVNQWPQDKGLREDPRMVCFVAVFIPRSTIERVGLLDEQFECYSHQDDDYCVRVRKAGLKIGIYDGCLVQHGKLPSTFRSPGGPGGDLKKGAEIFARKWGGDNRSV